MADQIGHDGDHDRLSDHDSFLITSAAPDRDAVFRARKRRYFIMMAIRIPALIIASIVYGVTQNGWLAVAIIIVSVPIPWIAVLKANDSEPRKHGEVPTYHYGSAHSITPELDVQPRPAHTDRFDDDVTHPVIDADVDRPGDDGTKRAS